MSLSNSTVYGRIIEIEEKLVEAFEYAGFEILEDRGNRFAHSVQFDPDGSFSTRDDGINLFDLARDVEGRL